MAYSNWGAFVFKNGVRMPTHEDATPYREEKNTPRYLQTTFPNTQNKKKKKKKQ